MSTIGRRGWLGLAVAVLAAVCGGASAQRPPQEPEQQGPPMPPATRRPRDDIDQADRAAEALRRLLRGETKPPVERGDLPPGVAVPLGPPLPPTVAREPAEPPAPAPPQDPGRQEPPPERVDPLEAARRALQGREPGLERVEAPQGEVRSDPAAASDPRRLPRSPDAAARELEPEYALDGFVTAQYRGRHADQGDHDHDLLLVSGIDYGDEDRNPFALHLLARSRFDLDGTERVDVFNGIQETWDDGLEARLYEGWIDLYRVPGLRRVRLGRMVLDDTPQFLFVDGLRVDSVELGDPRVIAGGYVGLPTRFYSASDSGELIGGAFAEGRFWDRGRARLDWVHVEDRREDVEFDDDLAALSVWQGIDDVAILHARHTLLDGRGRDLLLRADMSFDDIGLRSSVAYTELLTTQVRQTIEFDPYFDQLFELFPYRQLTADATKTIVEELDLTLGFDVRRLDEQDDEGQFNRDFERWFASLAWSGLAGGDVVVTATWESWQSAGDDVSVLTGDVSAQLSPEWRAGIGTDYSAFRYDRFAQREREDVTTVFARLGYRDGPWRASFDYEFEHADDLDYHVVEATVTWSF